jgi:DNA-binding winged helix-turn-helix (wHTH) protein
VEYVINAQVRYRSDDGALWPVSDEDSVIILTATMNRLLSYLLERQGQVVARDELLDNVWDAHGLRSSNHTLNKYISEIRKYFVNIGIEVNCIATVPRIGFMFSRDIDVQVIASEQSVTRARSDNTGNKVATSLNESSPRTKYNIMHAVLALIVILASASLIISGSQLQTTEKEQFKDVKKHFLFNYQSCPVYTTQKNSESLSKQKQKLFIDLAEENDIKCLNGSSFLYQVSESYLYGSQGRAFISRCTTKENRYISCLNNYWNGYERN